MSLYWSCDEKCNESVKSYTLPDGWEADPVHSSTGKFLGMRHTCPKCALKRRAAKIVGDDNVQRKRATHAG